MPWLGPYFALRAPVLGGLLYGPLVSRFAKEARGPGVPEVMAAVAQRGGRISPKVAVVKTLACTLTIGGSSAGREGPIVQPTPRARKWTSTPLPRHSRPARPPNDQQGGG
ncbi:hypothetical protein GCM10010307_56630 [Streptomyces vastus]|uniref:Uncharacterized protein n=1 Tax=Streptomyces vastus TaxID=285451 RepID=A0ABN3RBW1_9ACTN